MKTLVIISHPNIAESNTQQFFLQAIAQYSDVTVHYLDQVYPHGEINKEKERQLISQHDRLIFQFPLYWYAAPALLKLWLDQVLTEEMIPVWAEKELGVAVMVGVNAKEYQAGGKEHFSLDELLRPFQAIANKFQWRYLPLFPVHQFLYETATNKQRRLVAYQQYVTMEAESTLSNRTNWLLHELNELNQRKEGNLDRNELEHLVELIENNQEEIESLKQLKDELE